MVSRNKRLAAMAALAAAVLTTGCMTDGGARELDAKFEAGWRPSKADCVFGGATPTLDAYCARVNFGSEGVLAILRNENQRILAEAPGLRCTDHVAQARQALATYADGFELTELYSCDRDAPIENGRKVCHVSLLVRDPATGARFVVDNGSVLNAATTGGVGKYSEFRGEVDYAWIGSTPAEVLLAGR